MKHTFISQDHFFPLKFCGGGNFYIFVADYTITLLITKLHEKFITFTLALAVVFMQSAFSQNKGDKYFGGMVGVGVSSNFVEGYSTTSVRFNIAPEVGFFVADRLKIGASLNYELNHAEESTIHSLTLAPNIAYYVRLCNNFYYTPKFEIGFGYGHSEGLDGVGFALGLSLAEFEFRPSARFGISMNLFSFSYAYLSYPSYDFSSSGLTLKLGVNPTVGIKYYF